MPFSSSFSWSPAGSVAGRAKRSSPSIGQGVWISYSPRWARWSGSPLGCTRPNGTGRARFQDALASLVGPHVRSRNAHRSGARVCRITSGRTGGARCGACGTGNGRARERVARGQLCRIGATEAFVHQRRLVAGASLGPQVTASRQIRAAALHALECRPRARGHLVDESWGTRRGAGSAVFARAIAATGPVWSANCRSRPPARYRTRCPKRCRSRSSRCRRSTRSAHRRPSSRPRRRPSKPCCPNRSRRSRPWLCPRSATRRPRRPHRRSLARPRSSRRWDRHPTHPGR